MNNDLQVIGFQIGKDMFGVTIDVVHEIVRVPEVTAVPDAPEYVEGVINLRGKIVPVVDLRKRFGEKKVVGNKKNRILVTEVDNRLVGAIVDSTSEVLKLRRDQIDPPPSDILQDGGSSYTTGIGRLNDRLIVLVDMKKILARNGMHRLEGLCDQPTTTVGA